MTLISIVLAPEAPEAYDFSRKRLLKSLGSNDPDFLQSSLGEFQTSLKDKPFNEADFSLMDLSTSEWVDLSQKEGSSTSLKFDITSLTTVNSQIF